MLGTSEPAPQLQAPAGARGNANPSGPLEGGGNTTRHRLSKVEMAAAVMDAQVDRFALADPHGGHLPGLELSQLLPIFFEGIFRLRDEVFLPPSLGRRERRLQPRDLPGQFTHLFKMGR